MLQQYFRSSNDVSFILLARNTHDFFLLFFESRRWYELQANILFAYITSAYWYHAYKTLYGNRDVKAKPKLTCLYKWKMEKKPRRINRG